MGLTATPPDQQKLLIEQDKISKQLAALAKSYGAELPQHISEPTGYQRPSNISPIGQIQYEQSEAVQALLQKYTQNAKSLGKPEPKSEYKLLKYPHDLGTVPYKQNYIYFSFYRHKSNFKDLKTTQAFTEIVYPSIMMPLPGRLFYEDLTSRTVPERLGIVNNVLFENARNFGVTPNGLKEAISHGWTDEEIKFQTLAEAWGLNRLLNTDDSTVKVFPYNLGIAYNPNLTTLFSGENYMYYRVFYPSWNLVPKTEQDAITLSDIEKAFLKNSLPGIVNNNENLPGYEQLEKTINFNNHFTYPNKVQMQIFVDGKEFMKFKFLPAVVTRVDVSHNNNQENSGQNEISFFESDGKKYYTFTTLNLTLQENVIYNRDHVDEVHILN